MEIEVLRVFAQCARSTHRAINKSESSEALLRYPSAMPDTRAGFDEHVATVQQYTGLKLSESDTRAYLIDPLLRLLGFSDVKHLRREVTVPATKEFLDYELLVDGQPQVIVEAKALRHSLSDRHAAQPARRGRRLLIG
jgi:hypothetical protein